MSDLADIALLPAGLNDALPPDADFEASVTELLMELFGAHGYQRVKPPLMEFEESLFAGGGTATSAHAFRLMDPVSRRMLALRPDMTPQVARIATTRLSGAPRPLRLGYAGQILRVKGTQLRPGRQFGQAGAELIGAPAPMGDVEVVLMGVEALEALGVDGLTVDLGLPTLVPALLGERDEQTMSAVRAALLHKDATAVAALAETVGEENAALLSALLEATGPAGAALEALQALDLRPEAKEALDGLAGVVAGIVEGAPHLGLTIDPIENRGFEYHTGVTFTLFARNVKGELGRGGRYMAGVERAESSTGLTLFMDTVLQALPAPRPLKRVYLPYGTPAREARTLREHGWTTVAGLEEVADTAAEAARLHCTHLLADGTVHELKP